MGCGEQNMVLFTPNIYVTQYLEATNQLEISIKTQAINFMKNGRSIEWSSMDRPRTLWTKFIFLMVVTLHALYILGRN